MTGRAFAAVAVLAVVFGCASGPDATISAPADGATTSAGAVLVSGSTPDGALLVLVNGTPAASQDGFQSWSAEVALQLGDNEITAVAYGEAGRAGKPSTIQVVRTDGFDATAPDLSFSAIRGSTPPVQPAGGHLLQISGFLSRWHIAGPPWARFSASGGVGPAGVTVTADPSGQADGFFASPVVVTDDLSGQSRSLMATLDRRAATPIVSPTSLSFLVDETTPVADIEQTISISDELSGTVPAESVRWAVQSISVPWLAVTPPSGGTSPPSQASVRVLLEPLAGVPMGRYSGTIVMGWSNAQRSNQTVTISVLLDLRLGMVFDATAPVLRFSSIRGGGPLGEPASGYAVAIRGGGAHWHVAGPAWARFSATSGMGPATVNVTADPTGQGYGLQTSQAIVSDDVTGQSQALPITLDNRAAGLTVNPTTLAFDVSSSTPASGLTASLSISDELDGNVPSESVQWTVQSINAPWLSVTPSSGGTSPRPQVWVTVDPTYLVSGGYIGTITLGWHNAQLSNQTRTITVVLNLTLATTPTHVDFASPYVGVAGRAGALILRGKSFSQPGGMLTAFVGSSDLPGLVPDSDTQLRLSYPPLPAGRYPVGIRKAVGLSTTNAELVVLPAPGFAYQAISAPSVRKHLVWDAERQALYGINQTDQDIERYRFTGGSWVSDPLFVLPQLQDAALSPDGRTLIVLSKQGIYDLNPAATSWVPTLRFQNQDASCGKYLAQLAMGNNGQALVLTWLAACSGYTPAFPYDIVSHTAGPSPYPAGWLSDPVEAGSADGSRIYAGESGTSGPDVAVFNSLDGTMTSQPLLTVYSISVSADASRVILERNQVYSRALTLTGNLGAAPVASIASLDSSRAFAYRDDGNQPRLVVYDLNGALLPGAVYPVVRTILLPDAANSVPGNRASLAMAVSHDDSVVFISGDSKILVVPVN